MSWTININKFILFFILIYPILLFSDMKVTELKTVETVETVELNISNTLIKVDSLEFKVKELEKLITSIDSERALWGTALDRSNVIFSAFITILILLFGLGYFALFRTYMKSWEKKYLDKLQKLNKKSLDNETLVYRNMYYNCINAELWESSLLWASRVITKEIEKLDCDTVDYHRISDFIENMETVANTIIDNNIKLSVKSIHEVITNCELVLKKYGKDLKESEIKSLTYICEMIVK